MPGATAGLPKCQFLPVSHQHGIALHCISQSTFFDTPKMSQENRGLCVYVTGGEEGKGRGAGKVSEDR